LRCFVAVNYVAIAEALGVSPSVLAAGLAADNVICAVYFTTLFALASKIPPETSKSTNGEQNHTLLCYINFLFIEFT
jgi:uncharacterized membrane protein